MDSTNLKELKQPSTTSNDREAEWKARIRAEEAQRRRLSDIRALGGEEPYENYTFDNYDPTLNDTHRSLKICKEFDPTKGNLMLLGPVGTGKTHLATAIARRTLDSRGTARVYKKPELIAYIRGRKSYSMEYETLDVIHELCQLNTLVIDDIEDKPNTESAVTFLKLILDKRKAAKRTGMIITTNKPIEALYEILGAKVADRIDGMFSILVIPPETKSVRGAIKRSKKNVA